MSKKRLADEQQELLESLKAGDVVEIEVARDGHEATLRGECWSDDGYLFVGAASIRDRVDLTTSQYVTKVKVIQRAPLPEPPVGSVTRCTGCGAMHFRARDGWLDARSADLLDNGWEVLKHEDNCGRHEIIFNPEEA